MKRSIRILLFIVILCFGGGISDLGWSQLKYPQYSGYVNDYADILTLEEEAKLNNLLGELDRKTTAQIAVLTIETTSGVSIEEYSVELFQKWGIGQKGKDNGLLLLVSVKDRKVRIEVGYGLEGAITDAISSRIIRNIIVPHFKQADYGQGIILAVTTLSNLVAKSYNVELSGIDKTQVVEFKNDRTTSTLQTLFTILFIFLILGFRMGLFTFLLFGALGRRPGGYWYGTGYGGNSGGFSGGFGGFGGGLSGGGGASGSW